MTTEIIADPEVLEEEYIPQDIPCRESQKEELAFCLSPVEERMKPLDCLCHGKLGTGKTVLIKYVLQQLSDRLQVFRTEVLQQLNYFVCWTIFAESFVYNGKLCKCIEKIHRNVYRNVNNINLFR